MMKVKRLLAVVLATATVLTGSLGVSATEVPNLPDTNTTTTTPTAPSYKELKWGKNKISGVGEKVKVGDYETNKWWSESKIDQSYKIKVDKLSDVTISFKCNKNVTSNMQVLLWSKDNKSLYTNFFGFVVDKTDKVIDDKICLVDVNSYGKPKSQTYKMAYKSLPAGDYIIQIVLRGKKNTIGKELGGTLTLSKKKAYVGQVNGVKVKKSGKKYTITWNKAEKAKNYEYYFYSGSNSTKIKKISASKRRVTYTAKGKAESYSYIFIRAINGKNNGVWSRIGVGDRYGE